MSDEKIYSEQDLILAKRAGAEWTFEVHRFQRPTETEMAEFRKLVNKAFPLPTRRVPREETFTNADGDYLYRVVGGYLQMLTSGRIWLGVGVSWPVVRCRDDAARLLALFDSPTVEVQGE